ncbi:MAG: hypothetical protein A2Y86_08920 [Candidatus Aminicenantes bacterium RBG_13_62_12]|nr:MAG: hypothetical protein A2Y86_08920 [Candidatus Aminicenantes bacterium RBG_13_62_12]
MNLIHAVLPSGRNARPDVHSLYYLRTRDGSEIDLVHELGQKLHLFEIKAAMTVWPKHANSLGRALNGLKSSVRTAGIISRASGCFPVKKGIHHYYWKDIMGI